jgi:hypothetical protein
MPIEFFDSPEGPRVRQSFDSPTVYLDHWAIRLFSDDRALQDRLVTSLLAKGGTILLSHISLAEFAAATDARHCTDAEEFLERLLPNVFLTDFRLDEVLSRERAELNNLKRFWPTADLPQLRLFAERSQSSPPGFTMRGFIGMAHQHRFAIGQLISELVDKVSAALESARNDRAYVDKARRVPPSDKRPRTLLILGELMRSFNLDSNQPISRNDVIDLIHAAMPLNCCDYVLLDGPWAERVVQMKQRIAKTSMTMPLANCFSERDNGVSKFLADLDSFDRQVQTANRAVP